MFLTHANGSINKKSLLRNVFSNEEKNFRNIEGILWIII